MAKKMPKNNTSTIETTKASSPQRTTAKKTGDKKPNIFKRMAKGLKGVFSELKKVTWPKGKEVGKNTAVVLVVVVLFFLVLFVIDYVLGGLLGLTTNGKWATIFI